MKGKKGRREEGEEGERKGGREEGRTDEFKVIYGRGI